MANGLEDAIKAAANKIHEFFENIAQMTVETRPVEVGPDGPANFEQSWPVVKPSSVWTATPESSCRCTRGRPAGSRWIRCCSNSISAM